MDVLESFSLRGKTAVVTGAAGLLGRQIAEGLAEAGAKLFIASRNLDKLSGLAEELRHNGHDAIALPLDQSQEKSIQVLLNSVLQLTDVVDVLVNNAVLRPMADWDSPASDFQKSMAVNATGVFMMTRAFGESMAERGGGSIINIGSIQGMVGPDTTLYDGFDWGVPPDYFFHKGGMIQLSRYAASQLGSRGVRVNTVSPGGMFNAQDPVFLERYNRRTLLGRMANDRDFKGAIVFLASDASAYITGANIPVDGGYTAK